MGPGSLAYNVEISIVSSQNKSGRWAKRMKYMWEVSEHKRSCNAQFLVINVFLSIILIQAIVTCGTTPQAYSSTALAVSHMSCVNPEPSNNGNAALPAAPDPLTPGIVVINEVLTFPQSQWNCASPNNNTFSMENAWLEIYNPQDKPIDLYAAHASIDEGPDTDSYILHPGSIITAYGFLVVFPFQHPSSQASNQISLIRLQFAPQVVIDQVSIPSLAPDTSYARISDGSNNWQITTTPTIASSNQYTTETGQTGNDTSTHNQTTKQKSTNRHSGSISNDGASTESSTTGVQPTWNALSLPSSESNNRTTDNTTQHSASRSSTSSTTPADSFDLPKKILLTLPIVVLFLALLWGWQLSKKRYAAKASS